VRKEEKEAKKRSFKRIEEKEKKEAEWDASLLVILGKKFQNLIDK
jgi:hypothetical protein